MSGQEWQIEMLWRCATCSERNLGRHTQCQRCGKPKTGKEEYEMPGDTSATAAISDPELLRMANAGANWRCRFCGSDQRRYDGACGHCGAAQEQGVDLGALPPQQAPGGPVFAQRLQPATPKPQRWHLALVLLLIPLLFMLCGVCAFRQSAPSSRNSTSPPGVQTVSAPTFRDVEASLAGIEWEQSIQVERYKVLPGEGFEEARPTDAFAVKKNGQHTHHTDRVPDGFSTETYTETEPDGYRTESYTDRESCGQTCTSRPQTCSNQCTPGKNGFAKCKQVCTGGGQSCTTKYCTVTKTKQVPKTKTVTKTRQVPRFKDVPVMKDWYVWSYWGWAPQRTVKANGTTPETRWPTDAEVALNKGLSKNEKERSKQLRSYTLILAEPGGQHRVQLDNEEEFARYARASAFRVRIENGRARILEASPPASSAAPLTSR